MRIPQNIEDLFTQIHEGFRSVKLRSAGDTIAVENELQRRGLSYKTIITRNKKHGRRFVVMLVGAT